MRDLTPINVRRTEGSPTRAANSQRVLLVKPPFFTPWTPPLGIAILKTFLEERGHTVTCFDYNTDPVLWGTHHEYFAALQKKESISMNDGYSKLWWCLNAHFLMYANGASVELRKELMAKVVRFYSVAVGASIVEALDRLVVRFFQRLDELTDECHLEDYTVIGTSTYTTSLASSLYVLEKAKRVNAAIKTVMGGGVFADDLALGSDNLETLLRSYGFVDHVVLGEGETLMAELLAGTFADKRTISIEDLARLTLPIEEVPPPDFSDFDMKNYYHLTIEGARSCPFQCSFCSETIQWGDYRKKPAEKFVDQVLSLVQQHGIREFFMGDSLMDPYIMGFSRELIGRAADIRYDGYLRADKIAGHRDKARMWARSGLYRVRLGVESASEAVLKAMHKMTTPRTIAEALKSLANAGIRTTTYWIVGFPGETEQNFCETLDFIRDNHRLIYELEAHPYYYYPYGQVGSRFYESFSIYPPDVTDVTRFKVWEIDNVEPTREERYDRLRRISDLASRLGIPNIYTMAERYQAEERWLNLHPQAVEAFAASHAFRAPIELPEAPLPAAAAFTGATPVVVHQISVTEELDTEVLARALAEVARGSEMLQVELVGESYHAAARAGVVGDEMLCVQRLDATIDRDTTCRESVACLASTMAPVPGRSFKAALFTCPDGRCELYLLLHRGVGDGRSAALLCEDLYRAYEMHAAGREVRLQPVSKTFSQLVAERGGWTVTSGDGAASGQRKRRILDLGLNTSRVLFSDLITDLDLTPTEVCVASVARALEGSGAEPIAITYDERWATPELSRTVGPLTTVRVLDLGAAAAADLPALLARVRSCLRSPELADPTAATPACLLDLEAFGELPWLGGDAWRPQGWLELSETVEHPHPIVVRPRLAGDGLRVELSHLDTADLAAQLAQRLAGALQAILDYCAGYQEAKRFWRSELDGRLPAANLEFELGEVGAVAGGWAREETVVDTAVLRRLEETTNVEAAICCLASFSVLLSRLTGNEEVLLLVCLPVDGTAMDLPLQTRPVWSTGCSDFVRHLARGVTAAGRHGAYALTAIDRAQLLKGAAQPFDVLFAYHEPEAAAPAFSVPRGELHQGLALVLEVAKQESHYALRFHYRLERLAVGVVRDLAAHLVSVLDRIAAEPDGQIGEISFAVGAASAAQEQAEIAWATDAFEF